MLGDEPLEELAHRLVSGTRLEDPKVREDLYNGGHSAIEASNDPLIHFAKSIDGDLIAERKEYDAQGKRRRALRPNVLQKLASRFTERASIPMRPSPCD